MLLVWLTADFRRFFSTPGTSMDQKIESLLASFPNLVVKFSVKGELCFSIFSIDAFFVFG